ncbi:MAG TPA: hypothetical protein VHC22_23805 [Pirellulales bacterium]|nr:hypothetical protein [Pirellulales bacterium]
MCIEVARRLLTYALNGHAAVRARGQKAECRLGLRLCLTIRKWSANKRRAALAAGENHTLLRSINCCASAKEERESDQERTKDDDPVERRAGVKFDRDRNKRRANERTQLLDRDDSGRYLIARNASRLRRQTRRC